jgi:hypothetical protein
MDARYSRQLLVPSIGMDGQARIQKASYSFSPDNDSLRLESLQLYARRAGLQDPHNPPAPEAAGTVGPLTPKIEDFFQESNCRSIALGAADALNALNDALEQPVLDSPELEP